MHSRVCKQICDLFRGDGENKGGRSGEGDEAGSERRRMKCETVAVSHFVGCILVF